MLAKHQERRSYFGAPEIRASLFRKFIPRPKDTASDKRHRKELERLASSAPHLLADVGFVRDPMACSPAKEVWRRGTHSVTVFTLDRAVSVSL